MQVRRYTVLHLPLWVWRSISLYFSKRLAIRDRPFHCACYFATSGIWWGCRRESEAGAADPCIILEGIFHWLGIVSIFSCDVFPRLCTSFHCILVWRRQRNPWFMSCLFCIYRVDAWIGERGQVPDWETQSPLLHYIDLVIALMKVLK